MTEIQNPGNPAGPYNKIGGGLILIAVLLIYWLVALILNIGIFVALMFVNENTILSFLEPTGIKLYYALLQPYLIYELIRNSILILFLIIVLVYFFRKKKAFVKLMIAFIVTLLLLIPVDHYAVHFVFTTAHRSNIRDFIGYAVLAGIYILTLIYLLTSKRVKATFIH
jgi:Protein of unknown function (DUF2569)